MPAALALPSRCLRCQLYAVVWQTGTFRTAPNHIAQRCLGFSTHHPRSQETDSRQFRGNHNGGTRWRSVSLAGETHEARPKPIIILEDVPKAKAKGRDTSQQAEGAVVMGKILQEAAHHSPSAKQIESVVSERHKAPTQADVNASLEAIRVDATRKSTVMSTSEFEVLLRDLAKGYTIHQLGRYLDQSIRPPSKKVYELQTSPWRPGRTPLSQRHVKEVKRKGPSTKLRIAEQILRLVWEITKESEENRDGELEIKLKPWQISLLFDLTSNGGRYLDGLVTPQTLMQNCEVQCFRPENVMRISGRCQTAEEIARQLKLALLKVHRLEMDLKPLGSSEKKSGASPTTVFRSEDISYVAKLTESVIESEDELLAIYCSSRSGTHNARRLLLALLDQDSGSFNEIDLDTHGAAGTTLDMPVGNSTVGVHRRYHGLELLRTVNPAATKEDSIDGGFIATRANADVTAMSLAHHLDLVERSRLISTSTEQGNSYWRERSISTAWEATYCMLLRPKDKDQVPAGNVDTASRPRRIVQHVIPGLESLLSCFEALDASKSSQPANKFWTKQNLERKMLPHIKIHLKPLSQDRNSPTTFPRLEMRFHFSESTTGTDPRGLVLTGMQAVIDEQCLSVPLPRYATDMIFTRKSKLLAKLDAIKVDPSVMRFVRELQKSARSDKGALTPPAELSVKLPWRLAQHKGFEGSAATQDVTIKYLFERIEQIQKLEFIPILSKEHDLEMDADVNFTVEGLPKHLRLDYREVEGGAIYGNSSLLSLDLARNQKFPRPSASVEEQSEQTPAASSSNSSLELAGSALRIAHLLTRANSGTLNSCSWKA